MSILNNNPLPPAALEHAHTFPRGEHVMGMAQNGGRLFVRTNYVLYEMIEGKLVGLDLTVEPVAWC